MLKDQTISFLLKMRSGISIMIPNTSYPSRQKLRNRLTEIDAELTKKIREFIFHPETRDWNTMSGIMFYHAPTRTRGKIAHLPQYANGTIMATLERDPAVRRINVEDISIHETMAF